MNKTKIARGDIWLVDLDPTVGHEQSKKRPCLVISSETFNSGPAMLAVVVPLTSKFRNLPWFVTVDPSESGLSVASFVITNQPRTVSLKRFSKFIGSVSKNTLADVDYRLRILLCL